MATPNTKLTSCRIVFTGDLMPNSTEERGHKAESWFGAMPWPAKSKPARANLNAAARLQSHTGLPHNYQIMSANGPATPRTSKYSSSA
jgi:hypothetical protein